MDIVYELDTMTDVETGWIKCEVINSESAAREQMDSERKFDRQHVVHGRPLPRYRIVQITRMIVYEDPLVVI